MFKEEIPQTDLKFVCVPLTLEQTTHKLDRKWRCAHLYISVCLMKKSPLLSEDALLLVTDETKTGTKHDSVLIFSNTLRITDF